jgi:hypothetical protein
MIQKTFEIIKVANRKCERNGLFAPPINLGKVKTKALSFKRLNKDTWQKLLGNEGWMSVEDKEDGNYSAYGIDPTKMEAAQKVTALEKDNSELAKKVVELEAKLQEKEELKPPPTEVKKEEPKKETVTKQ